MDFRSFFSAHRKVSLIISWFQRCCFHFFLIFRSVGREREVFVRGARLSFVSAEINEAQGRHRAAGDEPTKKYRIASTAKNIAPVEKNPKNKNWINSTWSKSSRKNIGSTRLDPNSKNKKLDQLDLIQIQFKKYWINSTWSKSSTKNIGSTRLDQNPKNKNWINSTWSRSRTKRIGST